MAYLKLGRKHWIILVVALGFALVVTRGEVRTRHLTEQGKQAHDYLCYQKKVVIPARINTTVKYEQDVQLGRRVPIQGLTIADLEVSVRRDEDALRTLQRIHC